MAPRISLLMPTRGRPEQANRFLRSLVENTENPGQVEIVLYVDEDDTGSHSLHCEEIETVKNIGPRLTMGRLNSACYQRSSGEIVVPVNDDMVIKTRGWDRMVLQVHEKFEDQIYLMYPNDLFAGEDLCSSPIMSRKTCETLTRPFPEEYPGGFIDYHIFDIFKRLQCSGFDRVFYMENLIFEHLHYRYGKSDLDATYEYRGDLDVGDEVFTSLRKYRKVAAKRLQAGIEGRPLPDLPKIESIDSPPANEWEAVSRFIKIFLFDSGLPLGWRLHLFEMFSRRFLLKKYRYPTPTWQYQVLKKLSPYLSWPIRVIQRLDRWVRG